MAIIATQPGGGTAPATPNLGDVGQGLGKLAGSIAGGIVNMPYDAGHAVGETARRTVEGAKAVGRGAEAVGDAAAKGARTIGDATAAGAKAVGDTAAKGAKAVADGADAARDATVDTFKAAGAGLGKLGGDIVAGAQYQGERMSKGFSEGFAAAAPAATKGADGPDR